MKRVGRAAEFLAWTLFFALAALALALRFWLLPDIERYRERIAAEVSRTVGQPVRIGGIEAGWLGLNPSLHLRDVRIYDREGREALVLPAVQNQLSWGALARGRLKVHSLAIEGLRLQVRRDAAGALYVAGMKVSGDSGFADWALAQDEIVLRNAEIEWHDEWRAAPPLALSALNLRLRNSGDAHSVGLTARPPSALGSTVELRALLEGNTVRDPAAWKGRLYAELGYTDLAAWSPWVDYPWQIDHGQGALRAWLTLDGGEVRQATADVALTGVTARFGQDLVPMRLISVQGRLQGRAENNRYEVSARGLAAVIQGGLSIAPSDFQLSWTSGPGARGSLAASVLELQPLAHLAASLPLPAEGAKILARMKPRGRVSEARLDWSGRIEAPSGFAARGKFSELSAGAAGDLPGCAGLAGSFDTTEAKGKLQLATRRIELALPQVLPQPVIALDFLQGQLEWERHGRSGFAVHLPSLSFSNEHFSGNASGTYRSTGEGPASVDLAAQFNRADAAQLDRYLPHARLMGGQATREWLARGVLAGHLSDVRLRLRGELRHFPFTDPLHGHFSVSARLENGVLSYAPGWPRIEGIKAELLFERDRMHITGRSGSSYGVALANVQASVALRNPDSRLAISGQAEGATADFLKFVHASPVRRMTGGAGDAMTASGRGKLSLNLDVPLKDLAKTRVAGEYELLGNDLVLHAQLPPIEGASGKLNFTESTLRVNDLNGRLFGGAVAINGANRPDGGMQIVAKGDATVAGTATLFDHPWLRHVSGAASYAATVTLVKGRTQVLVESPLQGVASTLPAPLAKSAADTLALRLELMPDERIAVRLGRLVAADFMKQRAGVALTPVGAAAVRLPERPGTLVYGSLARLDLDKWLPLFSGRELATAPTTFDVRIGALDLYGRRMNDVSMRAGLNAMGWSAAVKSQELAGDVSYRREREGRLVARLTHLRIPEEYPGAPARGTLEPKDLPSLDLVAERFIYGGMELGRVELAGLRAGEDWRIEKLTMANAEANLAGTGSWSSGAPTRSSLEFELATSDAGEFLGRVGYPGVVKGGKAQLKASLGWNGHPGVIDYPSLSGEMQLRAQQGQFLEIEPGLGKLISLMSLQLLPRRITLDFRDVFSKGFAFDRIALSGQVAGGVMALKDFRMRGSSAQVEMSGDVDLARETQNLRVRVIPRLGDSASTVIALVNPLLAIPAAIAQKILKDPLGHIFAFDYSVTGAWTDPTVAKLGVEARAAEAQESSQ
jgi:uncharacterized protein (TIGR02099 family)